MIDALDIIGFCFTGVMIICLLYIIKRKSNNAREMNQNYENSSHHQDDIYNISSRVQSQGDQWPTHDAHLSLDHISIMNQMKPMYDDEPPSYDEVMKTQEQLTGEGSVPTELVIEAPKSTTTATRQQ